MDWFMLMVAGGLGAVSRYGVGRLFPFTGSEFPTATVICNLSGSLVLALLSRALRGVASSAGSDSRHWVFGGVDDLLYL